MTDYVLKYQVWNGDYNGKLATFRNLEQARLFLDGIKGFYPQAFIYEEGQGQVV